MRPVITCPPAGYRYLSKCLISLSYPQIRRCSLTAQYRTRYRLLQRHLHAVTKWSEQGGNHKPDVNVCMYVHIHNIEKSYPELHSVQIKQNHKQVIIKSTHHLKITGWLVGWCRS